MVVVCSLSLNIPLYGNHAFLEVESHSYKMLIKTVSTSSVIVSTCMVLNFIFTHQLFELIYSLHCTKIYLKESNDNTEMLGGVGA